jgi:hypothetical protein
VPAIIQQTDGSTQKKKNPIASRHNKQIDEKDKWETILSNDVDIVSTRKVSRLSILKKRRVKIGFFSSSGLTTNGLFGVCV